MQLNPFDARRNGYVVFRSWQHPTLILIALLVSACTAGPREGPTVGEQASSAVPTSVQSPTPAPSPSASAPVLLDARDANRIAGTWRATYTVTKVEGHNPELEAQIGFPDGRLLKFAQACDHGGCDATEKVFDFADGESRDFELRFDGSAYVLSDKGATPCGAGLSGFEYVESGSFRPTGIAADGRGAAQLTSVVTFAVTSTGAARAAGCEAYSEVVTVEAVRSAELPFPRTLETSSALEITQEFIHNYQSGPPQKIAVVEIKNVSKGPLLLRNTAGTMHSATNGSVLRSDSFVPYPDRLAPGEIGYYVWRVPAPDGSTLNEVGYFSARLCGETPQTAGIRLVTTNVTWTKQGARSDGAVRGTVTNTSGEEAKNVMIGVIFLGIDRYGMMSPVGFTWTRFTETLGAGQSRAFVTTNPSVPPDYEQYIAATKAFAYAPMAPSQPC